MAALGAAGKKLAKEFAEYFKAQHLELDPQDRAIVIEICATIDTLELCSRMVARHPVQFDEEGRKVKDWVVEQRNQRICLARLVKSAGLPSEIIAELTTERRSSRRCDE